VVARPDTHPTLLPASRGWESKTLTLEDGSNVTRLVGGGAVIKAGFEAITIDLMELLAVLFLD